MGVNFEIKDSEKLLSKIPYKRILAIVSLITAFLIFSPDKILEKVFLLQIRNNIKVYLGITFILCISIWIVIIASAIYKKVIVNRKYRGKGAKKRFQQLSVKAIEILLQMYHSPSHSKNLPINDAITQQLEISLFVGRGNLSSSGVYFDYFLQPWVVDYLEKHHKEYERIVNDEKRR